MARNKHIGSAFDDFLEEEGLLEETTAVALKRVVAWQLEQKMKERAVTKSSLAERMETSRAQIDRLLDHDNPAMTLESLASAAKALDQVVKIELLPIPRKAAESRARR